ncbi:hypothetical protein [Pelagicoccus sp. SDUM812003]|uniref:baeRF3 domain-containing protein n=1 Tax=Pelagicoccus sp. SDUM812003 TaxID=3041267 RepID=UPI002810112E|nr:hypothetical protein [Pelagicoccus sp. SDUM812003]MDQ8203834.1 hypothetical protein [Pelagicoccus sp. SDUM812003]
MNTQLRRKGKDYLEQAKQQIGPCLTVSLECDGGGKNSQVHRDRLRRAMNRMAKRSDGSAEIRRLFAELKTLIDTREMWSGEYSGVCIHISDGVTRFLKLPYPPVEKADLDDSFCLRPAADAIAALGDWLALNISLKSPRLYKFDGERARLLGEVDLPQSVYAFSEDGAVDSGQRAHVRRARGVDTPHLVGHGMKANKNQRELNEPVFMREVSHAIGELPESKELPMVVIGDTRVVSSFLDTYHHRGGEVFTVRNAESHPDAEAVASICRKVAWDNQQKRKSEVLRQIEEMRQRDGVFSNNVREVFEAAKQGRVSAAVVSCDEEIWCRMGKDEKPRSAQADEENAFEALDRIYLETMLKDGSAVVLPEDKIPGGKSVAAVFRW